MNTSCDELTPYYQDGKLHLSEEAFHLLQNAGLQADVIEAARHGLSFDDMSRVSEIRRAMEQFFRQLASNMGMLLIAN